MLYFSEGLALNFNWFLREFLNVPLLSLVLTINLLDPFSFRLKKLPSISVLLTALNHVFRCTELFFSIFEMIMVFLFLLFSINVMPFVAFQWPWLILCRFSLFKFMSNVILVLLFSILLCLNLYFTLFNLFCYLGCIRLIKWFCEYDFSSYQKDRNNLFFEWLLQCDYKHIWAWGFLAGR